MPKNPRILRYVVHHYHQSHPSAQTEEAWVSYSTEIDHMWKNAEINAGLTARSLAIHTACRYYGEIFAEYEGDEDSLTPVKSYRPRGREAEKQPA
jgi:hypothetical protein